MSTDPLGEALGGADAPAAPQPGTEDDSAFVWSSPDESVQIPFSRRWDDMLRVGRVGRVGRQGRQGRETARICGLWGVCGYALAPPSHLPPPSF